MRVVGLVQGVFFRDSVKRLALELGVEGWVANMEDGSVQAYFEGAPDAVDRMVEFCRTGPPRARVEGLSVEEVEPRQVSGFRILR